jgi:hypothetical protein
MDVWFIRTNGKTGHNQPGTKLFVLGERPNYPERRFNYRLNCLEGSFVRVGWPAAGDLRAPKWRETARTAYGTSIPTHWLTNLQLFATIRVGDIIAIPADREKYDVHFGVVVHNPRHPSARPGSAPYYYHYDIASGDWYENAHRVPVHWHQSAGRWAVLSAPDLGGLWLKGFGRVNRASYALVRAAKQAGLELAV